MELKMSEDYKNILLDKLAEITRKIKEYDIVDAIFMNSVLDERVEENRICIILSIVLNNYNKYKEIDQDLLSAYANYIKESIGMVLSFEILSKNLFYSGASHTCGIKAYQALENGTLLYDKTAKYTNLRLFSLLERPIGEYPNTLDVMSLIRKKSC